MTKTAVVTGASAGIGKAASIELAKAGHDGGAYYSRHQNEARETAQGVESSGGGPRSVCACEPSIRAGRI